MTMFVYKSSLETTMKQVTEYERQVCWW